MPLHKSTQFLSEIATFFKQNDATRAFSALTQLLCTLRMSDKTLFARVSYHKDTFYRFMENAQINWRKILYHLTLQLWRKIEVRSDHRNSGEVCLIVDDTDQPKRGFCIENIGRVHSHLEHKSILGFKALVLAITDGASQMLLDFALVGEKGKRGEKRRNRKLKCDYIDAEVEFAGYQVKLFFVRRSKRGKWSGLLTTDLKLVFFDAYRIYSQRWAIEVIFKEMKGLLGFGKCQARNFASQIAHSSIVMMQYNLLSTVKRLRRMRHSESSSKRWQKSLWS